MKGLRHISVLVPAVALVVLVVTLVVKRDALEQLAFLKRGNGTTGIVDQRPYETARTLAGLAVSAEEQRFAQDAERIADHEVDQAFALALRKSELRERPLTANQQGLSKRVDELRQLVRDDQAKVDSLTATAKTSGIASAPGDDLDVAQAQLGLDKDELTDSQGDLARALGDQRAQIQQELSARELAMKRAQDAAPLKKTAADAARQYTTLIGRATTWFAQRSRASLLQQAETQARSDAASIAQQHDELEKTNQDNGASGASTTGSDRVKLLKELSSRKVMMSILDDREQALGQLADIYQRWQAQVWLQHHIVSYLVLQSFAAVALILLIAALGAAIGQAAVRRISSDTRRVRTLETIVTLAAEAFGLLLIALVVFGTPSQIPTILGFATAGVTVVFQDLILAFFGWFSLMGRNGVRVGDWVEIDGVSGEVAEISLFHTVLLETGNWTTKGHPTGRRKSFSNSFALRGLYFNFSTHGQWMWDEITLNVPATANAYDLINQMHAAVDRETAADSDQAEIEWRRVAKDIGLSQFGAKPTVELRPAASGVDVIVRFVTRANERFATRNKLNAELLNLMEGTSRPALPAEGAAPAAG